MQPTDIPKVVELLSHVAEECNSSQLFDEAHAWEHVTGIICNGVSFVAKIDKVIIGVLMCLRVDLAFAQTKHLETLHLYVLPEGRSTKAAVELLKAAEVFADEHGIVVIFHQMDYQSALYGGKNNSRRVERLYKSRGYEGPVDTATVGEQERRVGISYRYIGNNSAQTI